MDAMPKSKVLKVICYHFGLSIYVMLLLAMLAARINVNPSGLPSDLAQWSIMFFEQLMFWLQPLAYAVANSMLGLALIPLWSICFGIIYVFVVGWLNHFPVLGKKVF